MKRRWALAVAGPLAVLGALAMLGGPAPTDAAFVSAESAALTAGAGVVPAPAALCTPHNGSPHVISLSPGVGGLSTTGYRVTMALTTAMPDGWSWQSGESEGVPMAPLGDSAWAADQAALTFGIELPFLAGGTVSGTGTVHAVGPGGWESAPVDYAWTIYSDWGVTSTTCDRV